MTDLNIGLSGRLHLVKRRVTDDAITADMEFPNIITDGGLNRWGSAAVITTCVVGSGATPAAATDVQLVSLVASSTTTSTPAAPFTYSAAERWVEYTFGFRFNAGTATGTLAEVGVGWASNALWSRALIRDTLGNPTTLTLLSDEYLDVFYTVRLQMPTTDVTGNVTINGTTYAWAMRPSNLQAYSTPNYLFGYPLAIYPSSNGATNGSYASAYTGGLVAVASAYPTGSLGDFGATTTVDAYQDGSTTLIYARTMTFSTTTTGAAGNIKTVLFSLFGGGSVGQMQWQTEFTPAIPKTNTQTLKLTFKITWSRAG